MNTMIRVFAFISFAILLCAITRADHTVLSSLVIQTDTESSFAASGMLTTTDTDSPTDGLDGPSVLVSSPSNPKWTFEVKHAASGWDGDGATGVVFAFNPTHVVAPHGEAPHEAGFILARADFHTVDYGSQRQFAGYARVEHPMAQGDPHVDIYSAEATIKATRGAPEPATGPNTLEGPFSVSGYHTAIIDNSVSIPPETGPAFGGAGIALASENIEISFNSTGPGTGFLEFNLGTINFADRSGGRTRAIDPMYAGDPLLAAQVVVSDLPLLGLDPDGRYRFGGGTVSVVDPAGKFTFSGSFSNYFIDETTSSQSFTSFGLLDNLTITDVADEANGPSQFLHDFVDTNLLGMGVPESVRQRFMGIDFAFTTGTDLVQLTNGFTQTAADVPADYYIGANLADDSVPEPSSVALLAILLASLFHRMPLLIRHHYSAVTSHEFASKYTR